MLPLHHFTFRIAGAHYSCLAETGGWPPWRKPSREEHARRWSIRHRPEGLVFPPLRLSPKYSATAYDTTARGLFVGEQRHCEEVGDVSMLV